MYSGVKSFIFPSATYVHVVVTCPHLGICDYITARNIHMLLRSTGN